MTERDEAVESWLRQEVVPAYDAMKADPGRGLSAEQVRQRLADERKRMESSRKTDSREG